MTVSLADLVRKATDWFNEDSTYEDGGVTRIRSLLTASIYVMDETRLSIEQAGAILTEINKDPRVDQTQFDPDTVWAPSIQAILSGLIAESLVQILRSDQALAAEEERRRRSASR
jgi:hypothetical protein